MAKARIAFDYLNEDQTRLMPAAAFEECGADGWLLFDFQGHNPVANRFLALGGLGSRRLEVGTVAAGERRPVPIAR